ncbi:MULTISPECIES: hypothetical protein [unclassified Streptomyces]|uniref:hypothetical protein n=1 Tax=unclassified Streptomyces TaxID=2593676 RepID=UPI000DC77E0C|nr:MULTISPECIES: hypothetical protein [unclassified Streptomyces]AWZ04889.1 hypothetical protein DRB89_09790 [Streptomyces sp. ICC4]AWZ13306.1 hypothetical protein DRB96_14365 [Streptomyces sp. ICC1]
MDTDDEDFLGVLVDAVTETRLKLLTGDEARAVMMLLVALEDETRSEEVRRAAGEMRFRLASRLALPVGSP